MIIMFFFLNFIQAILPFSSYYPLRSSTNKSSSNKQALGVVRLTFSLWHHSYVMLLLK
jgi:hypothetical protein